MMTLGNLGKVVGPTHFHLLSSRLRRRRHQRQYAVVVVCHHGGAEGVGGWEKAVLAAGVSGIPPWRHRKAYAANIFLLWRVIIHLLCRARPRNTSGHRWWLVSGRSDWRWLWGWYGLVWRLVKVLGHPYLHLLLPSAVIVRVVFCCNLRRAAGDVIFNDDLLWFLFNFMTVLTILGVGKKLSLLLRALKWINFLILWILFRISLSLFPSRFVVFFSARSCAFYKLYLTSRPKRRMAGLKISLNKLI